MRSISSCLSTELRSNGRGSSLSPEDLEIKEISVHKSAIKIDKIKENLNINDRNATVTSLALSRNQQLFVSICRFKHEMSSYLSFCAKSEMVVAVPVYSKDGKKIKIFILVTVELSRRIKNHCAAFVSYLIICARTSAKNYTKTHTFIIRDDCIF